MADVHTLLARNLKKPSERRIYYGDSETYGWHRVNP